MRVLIVTNQSIEERDNSYWCASNVYDILRRFTRLGELSLCAVRYNAQKSHLLMDRELTGIVDTGRVTYINKIRLQMSRQDRSIVSQCVSKADLVISYGASYDVFRIARSQGKKFMSFVVSCVWDGYWNHGWLGKLVAPYMFHLTRYTVNHSDYALYVTNEFLQRRSPTHAKYQCGCSNVRITTLDEKTLEQRLDFISKWDGHTMNIVTTAAVDVKYKGQQFVLKAMHQLKQQGRTDIHYYLIGGGSRDYLEHLAKEYGLESQLHFLGKIPHDEVFSVLDTMHVYVQPSLQEGLPRSMVEAMSRGLLCIGANTAAIPELIEPQFVTRRRSHTDIVRLLASVTTEQLITQAHRNFKEAYHYEDSVLNKLRNDFFDKVKNDILK